jgi:hypothetical protein
MVVQIVHGVVVAPTYHVGSFDDDANYLMAAHVLASGGGLTTRMPSGVTVVANYLPGYPALLVPLVWIWGAAMWPPRVLSALCTVALYPLIWVWAGRRGLGAPYRAGALGLMAINMVVATYSTMVMAEAPFVAVLMVALFALDRWERRGGWRCAVVVVALMAALVWLKEAGIGLVVGLVLYEAWRRRWLRAAAVSVGVGVLLLPGLAARWATGGATVGNRYSVEIGNGGQGFVRRLPIEVVEDLWSYLQNVLRQSVLPSGSPLPNSGPVHVLVALIGVTVPVFCTVGAVAWYRRHHGAESWMVAAYFVETLGYPYTNQRRVLLVLPVVVLWYVVGACATGHYVMALASRALSRATVPAGITATVLAAGVPTATGFTVDYMYSAGQQSSQFAGSPAMALLKDIGPPSAVVETDYRGSVAYFSGHQTAWTAITETTPYGPFAARTAGNCSVPNVNDALHADGADFVVVGDFNIPGVIDSPCLLELASSSSTAKQLGAVRLLSTSHDDTSVFELVGPGSTQPDLVDRTAGAAPSSRSRQVALEPNGQGDAGGTGYEARAVRGRAVFKWTWRSGVFLSQVSVGSLTSSGPVGATSVSIELPGGAWRTVAVAAGPVGDSGVVPYLFAAVPLGTRATGLKVSAATSGEAEVTYVNAIGPAG